ncbi:STAS domain-containing protein [Actinacidiphila acidipaludis]|uniref:STAS domain-containing protein n=1 Tax=Actinacidiphila acidipaludis TaxID=2873382 RepID=A0ABS7QG47_9ACTN|nr:STAS domain-containing protein [Streptomyces acidipaludis]MBY8882140.1 STAS domain-containing protein [Streptomyces acidipaludis]
MRLTEAAGRARAAVAGEIDLDCAPLLERVLRESLRGAPGGLDVDLLGVDFLDCSGLNVLLRVRADAVEAGLSMKVTGMSPVVRRVLELTGSAALFA